MTAFLGTRPNKGGLSAEEKNALSERLLDHVSSLEAFLPKLKPSKVSVPDYESAGAEGGRAEKRGSVAPIGCCLSSVAP
jgi:hypothetical protein